MSNEVSAPCSHAIVVLGQALNVDASPSDGLRDRIHTTIETFKTFYGGHQPIIIVSGGDAARVGITESKVMKRLLLEGGVPEEVIIEDDKSINSCQNAWYAGEIAFKLGIAYITLITSDFHMPRSLYVFEAVFKHLGFEHIGVVPVAASNSCSTAPELPTKAHAEHVRKTIMWEKHAIIDMLDSIFLARHISNVSVAPLGQERLDKAVAAIDELLLLHDRAGW